MTNADMPVEIFCCYAHADESWMRKLEIHLSLLKREGLISLWHDRQILAGNEWARDIDEHLETASIILLLISADFLASDYCYDIEMQRALERHKRGEARVIPIILRPCDWLKSPFAPLQCLPRDGKAVTTWQNSDEAFLTIAKELRRVIERQQILPRPLSHTEQQNRTRLMKRVRVTWIEGVLEHSLHQAALIALGLQKQPDALANPWHLEVQETKLPPRPLPAGTSIVQVYDEADGELLILGEPGAGKTTLLLELARVLLDRAEQDKNQLIPVIFNLSNWGVKQQPLTEWLVAELYVKYRVPPKVGWEWVMNDRLLVLLDGLDEVAETARESCVKTINAYKQTREALPLVVCCRKAEYFTQTTRVALQQAVSILPLTREQIDLYLASAGGQLASVRNALDEDIELQEMVKSPLLLNIIMLAYQGEVNTPFLMAGSFEARRQQIFTIYVKNMLTRRGYSKRYTTEHILYWLSWLALHMRQPNQNEFYIERMQPDALLPDKVAQRFHHTIVQLICCIETFILAATVAWLRGGRTFGEVGAGLLGELGSGPWGRVLGWMSPGLGLQGMGASGLVSLVFGIVAVLIGIMIDSNTSSQPSKLSERIRVRQGISSGIRNGMICGGLVGLFSLLLLGWHYGLLSGLRYGLSFGVVTGLIVGTVSGLTTSLREEKPNRGKRKFFVGILPGLCALLGFLGVDWMLHIMDDFNYGFVIAFFFYVLYSFGKADERIRIVSEIQPAEIVIWSWSNVRRNLSRDLARGFIIGLLTCLIFALCFGLVSGMARGSAYGIALGFVFGPIIGVSVGVAGTLSSLFNSGLESDMLQKQHMMRPNEGIHRSARNAVFAAAVFGPIGGIISGIVCGISFALIGHLTAWYVLAGCFAIVFGILFSFYFLMIRGFIACLEHICLRYYLWRRGYTPLKYVRFLNYAVEHILLQRIGGGYMFVHRLLLDYFAQQVSRDDERKHDARRSE